MPPPIYYQRAYNFTPGVPGLQINIELENVEQSVNSTIDALKDVRRDDGALKNGIVTLDSLSPQVAAGVGAGALASAEAAVASKLAAAASEAAAASSASAATAAAATATGALGNTEIAQAQAAEARTGAQTARDFANKWAVEAEGVLVDDGVNDPDYSAYHWAQVALDAAAGSIADGSVTTAKLADGILSADTTGRAKMADGFNTTAKLADGILSADTTGRAKMADGFVTSAKIADGTVVRVDDMESFTSAQQGQARANIGADILGGFRNKIINGDFGIWQRATSQTFAGYGSADRWLSISGAANTRSLSRVADNSEGAAWHGFCAQWQISAFAEQEALEQRIEGVRTLAGKEVTIGVEIEAVSGSPTLELQFFQRFGVGGSTLVEINGSDFVPSGSGFQKYRAKLSLPSVVGKTFGDRDCLAARLVWQSGTGTIKIRKFFVVEGDALAEEDPFSLRHPQQELALCQRYYQKSYPVNVAPGTAGQDNCLEAFSASGTRDELLLAVTHKVEMRGNPTITPYSWNTGAAGKAALIGGGTPDISVSLVGTGTPSTFRLRPEANQTGPARVGYHYTADAEL